MLMDTVRSQLDQETTPGDGEMETDGDEEEERQHHEQAQVRQVAIPQLQRGHQREPHGPVDMARGRFSGERPSLGFDQ